MTTRPNDTADFARYRVLIVDDHPGMLQSMRNTLGGFGISMSNVARNAADALYRIRNVRYDIVVCDYFLGDGANGQQLLEHLRRDCLIARASVFVMVSAERGYEHVVSTAELGPDDYLIKPFSAETLRLRLARALEKKRALGPILNAMDAGDMRGAARKTDEALAGDSRYAIDLYRLRGEIHLALADLDEAQATYERLIGIRSVPWARLGLGRTLVARGKLGEGKRVLSELIADTPDFLAAYDVLATLHERLGEADDAKAVLQLALEIAPNTLSRHRTLGGIAYRTRDLDVAEKAFTTVVTKSRHAIGRTADEHFMLARVQNDLGKWNEALGTLSDAGSNFDGAAGVAVRAAALEATVHRTAGNGREATAALTRALKLARDDAAELSHDATIDLARACFENERVEEGEAMLRNLVGNNHDSPALIGEVKRLFAAVGRGAEGAVLVDSAVADAVSLNNEGVRRAQAGDLEGAIALLETAAEKLPSNAHIVMNAAHSLIAFMLRNGPAPDKVARVRTYLDHIGSRQPEHPKYRQVATLFQQTQARLGVAA